MEVSSFVTLLLSWGLVGVAGLTRHGLRWPLKRPRG
jgi:hypothetical protein